MKKTAAAVCLTALTALTIGGCTTDTEGDPKVSLGSEQVFEGAGESSAAASSKGDPAAAAAAEAESAVDRYLSVRNALEAGRETDIDKLDQVAADPLLQSARADVIVVRSKGITNAGDDASIVPGSVKIVRNERPAGGAGRADVEVRMCIDQSKARMVYPDGSSARTPGSPDRGARQWWVRNDAYPDTTTWRVVGQSAKKGERC